METAKNVLAVLIVRLVRWMEGPSPKLTPRALVRARSKNVYTRTEDYATKARLYYGDDQY